MVVADDLVAQGREDPGQAVADDRRADVPHVHRLGDVGRREVDDDRSRLRGRHEAGTGTEQIAQAVRDPGVVQADVEEAGAGDLGRAGERLQVDGVGDLAARSRGLLQCLGQGHAAVGLVVAELRVIRRADGGLEGVGIAAFRSRRAESGS